jgi:hypothetical protein
MDYYSKYMKYKNKYLVLKQRGGNVKCLTYGLQQHSGECWHDSIGMMLMQSNIIKNDFVTTINRLDIDVIQRKLETLFSPENIDTNAYLLPRIFYIFYLKNKHDMSKINDIISKFLALSYEYVISHKTRMENRMANDELLKKYTCPDDKSCSKRDELQRKLKEETEMLQTLTKQGKGDSAEYNALNSQMGNTQVKLLRMNSTVDSIVCATTINKIFHLINIKKFSFSNNDSLGDTHSQKLALEILSLYVLRNNEETMNMYFDYLDFLRKPVFLSGTVDVEQYVREDKLRNDKIIKNKIGQNLLRDDRNLVGICCSVGKDFMAHHAISLYKCDDTFLLYDNELKTGPIICNWLDSFNNLNEIYSYCNSPFVMEKYGLLHPETLNLMKIIERDSRAKHMLESQFITKTLYKEEPDKYAEPVNPFRFMRSVSIAPPSFKSKKSKEEIFYDELIENGLRDFYIFDKIIIYKKQFEGVDSLSKEINYLINICVFYSELELDVLYIRLFEKINQKLNVHIDIDNFDRVLVDIIKQNIFNFDFYLFYNVGIKILNQNKSDYSEALKDKYKSMVRHTGILDLPPSEQTKNNSFPLLVNLI